MASEAVVSSVFHFLVNDIVASDYEEKIVLLFVIYTFISFLLTSLVSANE